MAATSALAAAAAALTVPLAMPAQAVSGVERTFFTADSDGDGKWELWSQAAGESQPQAMVQSSLMDYTQLAVSADASRFAAQYDQKQDNGSITSQFDVYDASKQAVRTIGKVVSSGATGTSLFAPALSPGGTTLVYSALSSGGFSLKKAEIGTGAVTTLSTTSFENAFLDEATLLGVDGSGWFTMPLAGGPKQPVSGIPADAWGLRVSPDRAKLAWVLDKSTDTADLGDVQVADVSLVGGVATVGSPLTISSGADDINPSFSSDGSTIRFVRLDSASYEGDVWSAPADASSPAALTAATALDEEDLVVVKSDDVAPAAASVDAPFTLGGTKASVSWGLPSDPDLSGVIVRRDGNWIGYFPAPTHAATLTGLVVGHTYSVSVQSVDRSGNVGPAVSRSLTAILPAATFGSPTTVQSAKAAFPVRFATGGTSATKYYVQVKPYGGSWKVWVNGATGATRTFGTAATTNVNATSATPGGNYTFSVRAVDAFGNSTASVAGTTAAVVPFDQSKATFSGSTLASSSSAYLGSYRRIASTKSYAKVTLVGRQLQVVGWKCASCGSFALYDGSTKIATVSTYYSSTRARTVLYSKTYAGSATHTFTIRPLRTAGHPAVLLDGFAMRR